MLLDFLFQIWKRLNGRLQWRLIWLFNSKFMVSVAGVIFDDTGKILLQRHRHWIPDVWGLPGGIVQRDETLEAALAREVLEESNLRVMDVEMLRVESRYRLRIEVYFRARLDSQPQTLKIQKQEVIEARFFCTNELPDNILPIQKEIIITALGGSD
jgi:ADP-ribose pyrophosphatase YjhB (NUDIX family)